MILTPLHFVYSLLAQGIVFQDSDSILVTTQNQKNQFRITTHDKKLLTSKDVENVKVMAEMFADFIPQCKN